jgi:hypothetical protein
MCNTGSVACNTLGRVACNVRDATKSAVFRQFRDNPLTFFERPKWHVSCAQADMNARALSSIRLLTLARALKRMSPPSFGLAALLVACGAVDDEAAGATGQTGTVRQAIASVMGGAETAVDAPWRLDPIGSDIESRNNIYPPIPIVVSLNDAAMQTDPETRVPYGNFCGVYVHEHWADGLTHYAPFGEHAHDPKPPQWRLDTLITPADSRLREIERSDKWPNSSDVARNHRLCRRWRGDNCANVLDASTSTEWHATIAYVPEQLLGAGGLAQNVSPLRLGDDVTLTLTAMFAPAGSTCEATTRRHSFQETVSVHLGENELPRFDSGWVYGDLHYHSQGTDNDGESGYAYRPTLQAMRAMGLDFAFATEHASASGQVTDLDPLFIDNFPDTFAPDFLERRAQNLLNTLLAGATVFQSVNAARDMNATRFAYLHQWLDRPASDPNPGANAEAMRALPGGRRAPRLFLGGEVDVIPEISAAEASSGKLEYGNGKS